MANSDTKESFNFIYAECRRALGEILFSARFSSGTTGEEKKLAELYHGRPEC